MNEINYTGVGKRKTAIAKAFLTEGSGNIKINGKDFETFFSGVGFEKETLKFPLILLDSKNKYDVVIHVTGGGISGQLDASRLAISKALSQMNRENRPLLKQNLLLRRDSRIKERRKYGLKKARKASQYSKR